MIYFAFTVFLSAFLLFQIQPLIGKYVLPWFGGSSAVWSATMLFFMVLLTGGYGYACWLTNRLSAKKQGVVHLAVVGASLALLLLAALSWSSPITPDRGWRPQAGDLPVWDIFRILAGAVGLPYVILATNGPLMQAWFSEAHPKLRPVEVLTAGIYLAGACQYPKDIPDSVAQASGAASKVTGLFSKEHLLSEPMTAAVNEATCTGDLICKEVCPFTAIEAKQLTDRDGNVTAIVASVNEGLCHGCGTCVAACRSASIQLRGFKDSQLLAEVDALAFTHSA